MLDTVDGICQIVGDFDFLMVIFLCLVPVFEDYGVLALWGCHRDSG